MEIEINLRILGFGTWCRSRGEAEQGLNDLSDLKGSAAFQLKPDWTHSLFLLQASRGLRVISWWSI
jgi:hypothetical protein